MKQTDIDRLKEICEKEGFHFDWDHVDHSAIIVREKKHLWHGVEFAEFIGEPDSCFTKGKIYPFDYTNELDVCVKFDDENDPNGHRKEYFKPSTESAYIDQLKRECFERFGEIKDGDRFDSPGGGFGYVIVCDENPEFDYFKKYDQFFVHNTEVYLKGKWAKKLPERVEVGFESASCRNHPAKNDTHDIHEYRFHVSNKDGLPSGDFGRYLAKCLSEYLNKP